MKKANQQRLLGAIGAFLASIEQEAYERGLLEGKRRAAAERSASVDEKHAVVVNLRAQRVKLREAMILIRQHVDPTVTDRGDSAVDSIAWAALQATPVDPDVSSLQAEI